MEHFQESLNLPKPVFPLSVEINDTEEEMEIEMGQILLIESVLAIRKLKNGKAPGLNEISTEMLKHIRDSLMKWQ